MSPETTRLGRYVDGQSEGFQVLGIGEPWPRRNVRLLNLETISDQRTGSQGKSRNILLDGAQTDVDLQDQAVPV